MIYRNISSINLKLCTSFAKWIFGMFDIFVRMEFTYLLHTVGDRCKAKVGVLAALTRYFVSKPHRAVHPSKIWSKVSVSKNLNGKQVFLIDNLHPVHSQTKDIFRPYLGHSFNWFLEFFVDWFQSKSKEKTKERCRGIETINELLKLRNYLKFVNYGNVTNYFVQLRFYKIYFNFKSEFRALAIENILVLLFCSVGVGYYNSKKGWAFFDPWQRLELWMHWNVCVCLCLFTVVPRRVYSIVLFDCM